MNTDDMRKLYEGLKIIFGDETPGEKESPNGGEEDHQETSQETSSEKEAANRVSENEPGSASSGDEQPGPNSSTEPITEPTSSEEAGGEPESANESDGAEEPENPRKETPGEENASNEEEEKEDFSSEEINQAVTIAEQLGLPQEPVENLFSLIDRDKLVNNEGEIGKEELTNTLKLLEAIVLRKPAKTPNEENYGYDPENARQSTGFGKYL